MNKKISVHQINNFSAMTVNFLHAKIEDYVNDSEKTKIWQIVL